MARAFFQWRAQSSPAEERAKTEETIDEEEIALTQQWRDAMKRQVYSIIVNTFEVRQMMLEEVGPDSDSNTLRVELMAVPLDAVAAMGAGTKGNFIEMAKNSAQEYFDGDDWDDA